MNTTGKLAAFFETDYPLNKEGVAELLASFDTVIVKKNSLLLEAGKIENKLKFLEKGVVREYYATKDKETNINFYARPEFLTDFSSFNNSIATKKYQECITNVELKVLDKRKFLELLRKYDCGKSFIDLTFQKLLEQKELFEYNRITMTPEELYNEILTNKPCWFHKIPQYHIASYLGITPETLSRIRSRIS